MRDTVVRELIALAREDQTVNLITGDLGFGVLKPFWEALPDRFINAGITEQNLTGVAAGMALEGKKVFTYSIANFPTLRCLEQIRNDCAYHDADVKIICVGGGYVYGALGMSHHATEDIACMRALPNVTVICPADAVEAKYALRAIAKMKGTCYLRLGRGGEKLIHTDLTDFEIGKAYRLRDAKASGAQVAVFSTGAILEDVTNACDALERQGVGVEQYSFPTVKPIDRAVIEDCARRFELIVTVEEHNVVGGFGSAVAEVLAELPGAKARLLRIGLNDTYGELVGSQRWLREAYGLSAAKIAQRIEDALK